MLEYQAKELLSRFGIPVPPGAVATNMSEAQSIAKEIGFPVVIKAQVPVGGRGKAGAIAKVSSPEDLRREFHVITSMRLGGYEVKEVLVEKAIEIWKELYVSFFLNRSARNTMLIVSGMGGVDVEELGEKRVFEFETGNLDEGAVKKAAEYLCSYLGGLCVKEELMVLIKSLHDVYERVECELVEVNPLAVTTNSQLLALDAKIITDDNALYRHPELLVYEKKSELERIAESHGFSFVEIGGDVAVIGNGAGLVLSTLDMVKLSGLNPACFLDLGGGAPPERVYAALKIVNRIEGVKLIFLNVFGGITNCVSVAEGLIKAKEDGLLNKPTVVRLTGTEEEKARSMLSKKGVTAYTRLEDALEAVRRYLS